MSIKAAKRVQSEIQKFVRDPPENIPKIGICDTDLSKVYFLIHGPIDTPYEGGEYVVEMTLTNDYPMRAPVIRMLTPSGRFIPGDAICTTFTHFHQESWSPAYNFSTLLVSLVSFMTEEAKTVGSMSAPAQTRRELARSSKQYNLEKGYMDYFS